MQTCLPQVVCMCANQTHALCVLYVPTNIHTHFVCGSECFKRKMPWVDEGSESVIHQQQFPNPLSATVLWV